MAAKKKAAKRPAKKARSRNGVMIEKAITKTVPWWAFLPQNYDMCSVPDSVRHAKSPQEAWDACDADELMWALEQAGVDLKIKGYSSAGYDTETGNECIEADQIRERYPTPPRAMLRIMERWLKAPPSEEDECFRPERYE